MTDVTRKQPAVGNAVVSKAQAVPLDRIKIGVQAGDVTPMAVRFSTRETRARADYRGRAKIHRVPSFDLWRIGGFS